MPATQVMINTYEQMESFEAPCLFLSWSKLFNFFSFRSNPFPAVLTMY